VLESFDLVFLSDWMYDDTQIDSMNALFPVRQSVDYSQKVRGNYYERVKLAPTLAADEVPLIMNSILDCLINRFLFLLMKIIFVAIRVK